MQEVIPLAVGEQRADCGDISLKDQPINKLINNYKKEIKLKNQAYGFIAEKGLFSEFELWTKKNKLCYDVVTDVKL